MERRGDEVHMDETEASGASKEGVVRWVLIIGTFLAIAFLTIIWVTGAWTQNEKESQATASGRIEAAKRDLANDSMVGDRLDEMDTTSQAAEKAPDSTLAEGVEHPQE
jgi:hypothetical protein